MEEKGPTFSCVWFVSFVYMFGVVLLFIFLDPLSRPLETVLMKMD